MSSASRQAHRGRMTSRTPESSTYTTAEDQARPRRDRYLAARFPGVIRNPHDLRSAPRMLEAVVDYLREGDVQLAQELLELAVARSPDEPALWRAQSDVAAFARAPRDGPMEALRPDFFTEWLEAEVPVGIALLASDFHNTMARCAASGSPVSAVAEPAPPAQGLAA